MRKTVKIKFQNGIDKEIACRAILNELHDEYNFEETNTPDFILFGPYGNDTPPPGPYIRIGYFCENIRPNLSICEWAFGIPYQDEVNSPRYARIQWHDFDPQSLVKPAGYNAAEILEHKKHFCAFVYNTKIPYREEFFKQLSKYKRVDAPGKSMNNMVNHIDTKYQGNIWQRKQQFLRSYKFTVAFENYVYPGYQTEKLHDAMVADSIPIYCGDSFAGRIFNTNSFINATNPDDINHSATINFLEKHSQQNFKDIRPAYYHNPLDSAARKLKIIGRQLKMKMQFNGFDFSKVIERIIELDQDDAKYIQVLNQPWYNNNVPPANASLKKRWVEIFESR